jgi:hypothetical protein
VSVDQARLAESLDISVQDSGIFLLVGNKQLEIGFALETLRWLGINSAQ